MDKVQLSIELKKTAQSLLAIAEIVLVDEAIPKATEPAPAQEAKTVSFEELRGLLATKSRNGHKDEVIALIKAHGADKLSDVKPEEFEKLMAEAEAL